MGFLRLLLALAVAQQHLYIYPYTGSIAVFGFFVLSGFMVTMIMNEVYEDTPRGKGLFLLNRFLRIYPVYWVCLKIAIYCLGVAPFEAYHILSDMALPRVEWWRQYWIFGLVRSDGALFMPRVVEPAWSLNIELVYYLLMGLVIGRNIQLAWCWFGFSLLYMAYQLSGPYNYNGGYFSYLSNSLLFSSGAMAYHYRHTIPRWRLGGQATLLLLAAALLLLPRYVRMASNYWGEYHFVTVPFFAYIILQLYRLGRERKHRLLAFADRLCGRVSYPFFLLHAAVGAYVSRFVVHWVGHTWNLYVTSCIYTLLIGVAIVCVVEMPLETLRAAIRRKANHH